MIVLREMSQEEYPVYCQYFINEYSKDIVQNQAYSIETANELAQKALNRCFPNGLETSEHTLLCIDTEVGGELCLVGYLWHSVNLSDNSTFIYDFFISSEHRGLGLGTLAISALEKQVKPMGIHQIKLRVAFNNERALKLYKEVGFIITGFNMSKSIAS
ncbi:GNAT family N-acetyltransferase [Vibrio ostreicida]|uniref:GNAT family N-acetyltransferase n=1 Tax=Vibrio ostreicida TaxID=526588 RepID=A0ABT8BTX1_9VIBR|nr:GNAT family N-acetyltransferase [Vibrio ostreicida]MDN3609824.1 GNAT family N-acetyltransferase [Vibrio ostreicida]NPD09355.1 GNAT family N-acetyltransferase [Vibrio ostreicida]